MEWQVAQTCTERSSEGTKEWRNGWMMGEQVSGWNRSVAWQAAPTCKQVECDRQGVKEWSARTSESGQRTGGADLRATRVSQPATAALQRPLRSGAAQDCLRHTQHQRPRSQERPCRQPARCRIACGVPSQPASQPAACTPQGMRPLVARLSGRPAVLLPCHLPKHTHCALLLRHCENVVNM